MSREKESDDISRKSPVPRNDPVPINAPVTTDTASIDSRKVFVVHGRNNTARDAMYLFLRSLHLLPLEWEEVIKQTGEASPFVGDIVRTGFEMAQAVVVLFTGDDLAHLRKELQSSKDKEGFESQLMPQPRPNVLFEAGYAFAAHRERTVLVELGELRPISDLFGRHTIRLSNQPNTKNALAGRLETAGCPVNRDGSDWLGVDFEAALLQAPDVSESPDQHTVADTKLSDLEEMLLFIAQNSYERATRNEISGGLNWLLAKVNLRIDEALRHSFIVDTRFGFRLTTEGAEYLDKAGLL